MFNKFKEFMNKKKKKQHDTNHVVQHKTIVIDKDKLCIKRLNDNGTELAIIATSGNNVIELHYQDPDSEYLANRVKEILEYIQD